MPQVADLLVDTQALEAESGVGDQLPCVGESQDNLAQYSGVHGAPTDSRKDSKQKELTEKERG